MRITNEISELVWNLTTKVNLYLVNSNGSHTLYCRAGYKLTEDNFNRLCRLYGHNKIAIDGYKIVR